MPVASDNAPDVLPGVVSNVGAGPAGSAPRLPEGGRRRPPRSSRRRWRSLSTLYCSYLGCDLKSDWVVSVLSEGGALERTARGASLSPQRLHSCQAMFNMGTLATALNATADGSLSTLSLPTLLADQQSCWNWSGTVYWFQSSLNQTALPMEVESITNCLILDYLCRQKDPWMKKVSIGNDSRIRHIKLIWIYRMTTV